MFYFLSIYTYVYVLCGEFNGKWYTSFEIEQNKTEY